MKVLTDKAEIQQIGQVYVFIMGGAQIPQDLAKVYNGTIRSAGYRNVPYDHLLHRHLVRPGAHRPWRCAQTAAFGCGFPSGSPSPWTRSSAS